MNAFLGIDVTFVVRPELAKKGEPIRVSSGRRLTVACHDLEDVEIAKDRIRDRLEADQEKRTLDLTRR